MDSADALAACVLSLKAARLNHHSPFTIHHSPTAMWDRKRQIVWLVVGLAFGSFFLYPLAHDDAGQTDWSYFAQLELLLLVVMLVMFFIYGRRD